MLGKRIMILSAALLAVLCSAQAGVIPAAFSAPLVAAPVAYAVAPAAYAVAPYASSYSAHSVNHAVAAPVVHAPVVHAAPARLVAPASAVSYFI